MDADTTGIDTTDPAVNGSLLADAFNFYLYFLF